MIITKFEEIDIMDNAHNVDARNLYNKPEAMVSIITLKPGQNLKRHITPVDVAFYVLEGRPSILVGDEKLVVKQDDIIESPKDIVHCIYNESDAAVRVLVMKLPKPTQKTIFIK